MSDQPEDQPNRLEAAARITRRCCDADEEKPAATGGGGLMNALARCLLSATRSCNSLVSASNGGIQPSQFNHHNKASIHCSLLVQLLLPLLIVFLLPTIKLDPDYDNEYASSQHETASRLHPSSNMLLQAPGALLTLVRLPLGRLRFAVGLAAGADAHDISERQDLQEEETVQLVAPGEHQARASTSVGQYLSVGPHYAPHHRAPAQPMALRAPPHRATTTELTGAYAPAGAATESDAPGAADMVSVSSGGESPTLGDQSAPSISGTVSEANEGPPHVAPSNTALQTRADLPAVRALNVKCEKNHMTVNIVFDRPFYGLVFSKGHYNDQKCVHLPANSGQSSVNFDIHLGKCGMSSSDASGQPSGMLGAQHQQQVAAAAGGQQQPTGLYIENTIIIQYDPQVQEIYDQARKLRCTWYDYYEKSVTFRPYNVDMLDAVTANFLGDNIQCWMQIQVGKGPWSSEVAGIVKIGQTMTMVLAIKDDENRFDMLVRNCVAHDGKHQPIQLVDEYGCVARPKIMGKFQKVRNFGPAATVVSYAHFQAFKFPDSMSVHFQCVIQVCRYECPEPACNGSPGGSASSAGHLGGAGDQSNSDYAVSGTEIVASKEVLPTGSGLAGAYHGSNATAFGAIKLDQDAQMQAAAAAAANMGRVQVKLDTSMYAGNSVRPAVGGGTSTTINGGPLPPHLLHTAASQDSPAAAYASPSSSRTGGYLGGAGGNGRPPGSQRPLAPTTGGAPQLPTINGRPPLLSVRASQMAPSNRGPGHFSSPYQMQSMTSNAQQPRTFVGSTIQQRLGELPDGNEHKQLVANAGSVEELPSQQANHPLSLIALPRGLRMSGHGSAAAAVAAAFGAPSHSRERRSVIAEQQDASRTDNRSSGSQVAGGRGARSVSGGQTSTDIRTQKSIQVVSPDDVAFSLLDPADEMMVLASIQDDQRPAIGTSGGLKRRPLEQQPANVCFSATKLMMAILVTLVALAISIVIVAYVVLKQRARLAYDKLAHANTGTIYQVSTTPVDLTAPAGECRKPEVGLQQHQAAAMQRHHHQQHQAATCTTEELLLARQREELQQRNNCLARLYSQFVPANYWRGQQQ